MLAYHQNTPFEILRTIAAHREPLAALDAVDRNEVHSSDATITRSKRDSPLGK